MARRAPDGESRLIFVPDAGIADVTDPTDDELNAGTVTDVTPFALEWDFPESGQTIDTADMSSSFNKQDAGTFGGDMGTVMAFRDSTPADDDAWTALPRATRGHFVERLFGGADDAFAAADEVSIYSGVVIARSMQGRQRNNALRFQVQIAITDEPSHNVAVSAAS